MYHEPEFEPTRAEMMEILRGHIHAHGRTELLPLWEADGRVSAEDVTAPYAVPAKPSSGCDGIAVRFDDFAGGVPDTSGWAEGREYVYSNTGVVIPDGYDTVIPIEEVERCENGIRIRTAPSARGEEVEPAGKRIRAGELLLAAGEIITPPVLGLLAAAGYRSAAVFERPSVVFIPTGDELVPGGGEVPVGKNVESNSVMLGAFTARFGGRFACLPIQPDCPEAIRGAVCKAVRRADLLIIGAGSSKGSKDYTMDVLRELGTVIVQEIGVAPGKHCSLTIVDGVPVMGVPGPPGGAQLITQVYVKAAIELLTFGDIRSPRTLPARLASPVSLKWIDFMQSVTLSRRDGELLASPDPLFTRTRAESRNAYEAILYCTRQTAYEEGQRVEIVSKKV